MKGSTQPMIKSFKHKSKSQQFCFLTVFFVTVLALCFNILCESYSQVPIDYIRNVISLFILLAIECCVLVYIR